MLRDNFADLYREVQERFPLDADDLVLDVGSNDGTLLANFQEGGHRVLGIEPTDTGAIARERGIPTLQAFFDADSVDRVAGASTASRELVTAANVFAHIPDVHEVVASIERLVGSEGMFVSESHYLGDLSRRSSTTRSITSTCATTR